MNRFKMSDVPGIVGALVLIAPTALSQGVSKPGVPASESELRIFDQGRVVVDDVRRYR